MSSKKEIVKKYLYKIILKNCHILNYRLPSENTLCRIHKVSRITVKTAISELFADGLIYTHQGKGTYISSQAIRILLPDKTQKDNIIGVLLPDLKSMFILNLISGINKALTNRRYNMLLYCTEYSQQTEESAINELLISGVKGFIVYLVDNQLYNQEMMNLLSNHVPFVTIDRYLDTLNSSIINSDNKNAVYVATKYLIELGHSSIGIISTVHKGTSTLEERIAGYINALTDSNILVRKKNMLTSLQHYNASNETEISNYIKKNKKMSAIIILNSNLALITLRVLNKIGILVPENMCLIAYEDDFADFADIMQVKITSIRQDTIKIGETAANVLVDQINKLDNSIKQISIASKLIIRQTTIPYSQQIQRK